MWLSQLVLWYLNIEYEITSSFLIARYTLGISIKHTTILFDFTFD